jgi:hypothetical protein
MMRRGLAYSLAAVGLALGAGCGPNDNSKIQTPNDQPIGAPNKGPVKGGPGVQPGPEPPQKQVPGRPGGKVS